MNPPKETVWQLLPHTKAKHDILRAYLQAWVPIMGTTNGRILYIDGFSGPGEYSGGEEGSPLIALRAVLDHSATLRNETVFIFIDSDRQRVDNLEGLLSKFELPGNVTVSCVCGKFDENLRDILDYLDEQHTELAPTFAFVDPFGWAGTPLSVIQRIMGNPKCEVLVSFMYEAVSRWIAHPNQEKNFDDLFGTTRWREVGNYQQPRDRLRFLHDLYRAQLQEVVGAQYVRSFKMIDSQNKPEYFLFHATNHIRGLEKMKDAMWQADPLRGTEFSDTTDLDQAVLFTASEDSRALERLLQTSCCGRMLSIEEIEEFVLVDTAFRKSHLRPILKGLERRGQLIVHSDRKRKLSYPPGTKLTILSSEST